MKHKKIITAIRVLRETSPADYGNIPKVFGITAEEAEAYWNSSSNMATVFRRVLKNDRPDIIDTEVRIYLMFLHIPGFKPDLRIIRLIQSYIKARGAYLSDHLLNAVLNSLGHLPLRERAQKLTDLLRSYISLPNSSGKEIVVATLGMYGMPEGLENKLFNYFAKWNLFYSTGHCFFPKSMTPRVDRFFREKAVLTENPGEFDSLINCLQHCVGRGHVVSVFTEALKKEVTLPVAGRIISDWRWDSEYPDDLGVKYILALVKFGRFTDLIKIQGWVCNLVEHRDRVRALKNAGKKGFAGCDRQTMNDFILLVKIITGHWPEEFHVLLKKWVVKEADPVTVFHFESIVKDGFRLVPETARKLFIRKKEWEVIATRFFERGDCDLAADRALNHLSRKRSAQVRGRFVNMLTREGRITRLVSMVKGL